MSLGRATAAARARDAALARGAYCSRGRSVERRAARPPSAPTAPARRAGCALVQDDAARGSAAIQSLLRRLDRGQRHALPLPRLARVHAGAPPHRQHLPAGLRDAPGRLRGRGAHHARRRHRRRAPAVHPARAGLAGGRGRRGGRRTRHRPRRRSRPTCACWRRPWRSCAARLRPVARATGALSAAIRRAETIVGASGKLIGIQDIGAAEVLWRLGKLQYRSGNYAAGEATFGRLLEIHERVVGPDRPGRGGDPERAGAHHRPPGPLRRRRPGLRARREGGAGLVRPGRHADPVRLPRLRAPRQQSGRMRCGGPSRR